MPSPDIAEEILRGLENDIASLWERLTSATFDEHLLEFIVSTLTRKPYTCQIELFLDWLMLQLGRQESAELVSRDFVFPLPLRSLNTESFSEVTKLAKEKKGDDLYHILVNNL